MDHRAVRDAFRLVGTERAAMLRRFEARLRAAQAPPGLVAELMIAARRAGGHLRADLAATMEAYLLREHASGVTVSEVVAVIRDMPVGAVTPGEDIAL